MTDTQGWSDSDKMGEVDNGCGEEVERTVRRFLPRDVAREIRRKTVIGIVDQIWGEQARKAQEVGGTPDEGPHETVKLWIWDHMFPQDQGNCRG